MLLAVAAHQVLFEVVLDEDRWGSPTFRFLNGQGIRLKNPASAHLRPVTWFEFARQRH